MVKMEDIDEDAYDNTPISNEQFLDFGMVGHPYLSSALFTHFARRSRSITTPSKKILINEKQNLTTAPEVPRYDNIIISGHSEHLPRRDQSL